MSIIKEIASYFMQTALFVLEVFNFCNLFPFPDSKGSDETGIIMKSATGLHKSANV